jgi:hypothetical protein
MTVPATRSSRIRALSVRRGKVRVMSDAEQRTLERVEPSDLYLEVFLST